MKAISIQIKAPLSSLLTLSRDWMYLTWRGINSSDDIVTWGQCEEQGQAAAESGLRVCTLRRPDPEP